MAFTIPPAEGFLSFVVPGTGSIRPRVEPFFVLIMRPFKSSWAAGLLALLCFGGTSSPAQTQTSALGYEPFSDAASSGGTRYAAGDNLAGQTSADYAVYDPGAQQWFRRTASGSTQPVIASGDLSYPGLNSSGGGRSARFDGNGDSALMNLLVGSGGVGNGSSINGIAVRADSVYFSFALKLADVTSTLQAPGSPRSPRSRMKTRIPAFQARKGRLSWCGASPGDSM